MAYKHPYTIGNTALTKTIEHLRRTFPPIVNVDIMQKLGIAPNNETYVINTLRFIGILDDGGKRTEKAADIFSIHGDTDFAKRLEELIISSYNDLFELHGDLAWSLDNEKLISFFRTANRSGDNVGRRQASTFQTLAALSGHGTVEGKLSADGKKTVMSPPKKTPKQKVKNSEQNNKGANSASTRSTDSSSQVHNVMPLKTIVNKDLKTGITIRVEINLPSNAEEATYDAIFKSIRKNLLILDDE